MAIDNSVLNGITVDPEDVDADGFASLWSVALASTGKNAMQARELASRLLGFLCKKRFGFIVVSSTDIKYLDEWFERDDKLLYDWSPTSERVDVMSQYAHAPVEALLSFLKSNRFDPDANHNPRRAARVEWFRDDWNVG